MAFDFGLLPTGFNRKPLERILLEVKTDIWDGISDQIDLSSESPEGQIVGIFCGQLDEVWQALEALDEAFKPAGATGAAQTSLSLLTGTERRAATKTVVTATVNIDAGFSQAPGTMFAHVEGDPTKRFTNRETVENTGGSAASFEAIFEAEMAGAVACLADQLTVIAEPIAGWNSIQNDLDGTTGDPDESDAALRLRREEELRAAGSTTADAIEADVLRELGDNVTHCKVLENDSNITDANGVPPHAIEVIARGTVTDAAQSDRLASLILDSKAAGIQATGTASRVVTDSEGNEHNIGHTWVADVDVYLEIDLTIDEDAFPEDGDDQIKAALIAVEANSYQPGSSVIAERLKAAAFAVAGVIDVPALRLGTSPSPVGTSNLAIAIREQAKFDTTRILVTHV